MMKLIDTFITNMIEAMAAIGESIDYWLNPDDDDDDGGPWGYM